MPLKLLVIGSGFISKVYFRDRQLTYLNYIPWGGEGVLDKLEICVGFAVTAIHPLPRRTVTPVVSGPVLYSSTM